MSTFTTSINEIYNRCSNPAESMDVRIDATAEFIFNFTFPWYSEDGVGLQEFKRSFITNFFLNEIGFETLELFRLKLKNTLSLRMPYYKQLYDSSLLKIDPLLSFKNERELNGSKNDVIDTIKKENGLQNSTDNGGKNTDITLNSSDISESNIKKEESLNENNVTDISKKIEQSENSNDLRTDNLNTKENEKAARDSTQNTTGTKTQAQNISIESIPNVTTTTSVSNRKEVNNQNINSDNPQVTFSTNDYASNMQRGQEQTVDTNTTTVGHNGKDSNTTTGTITDTDNTTIKNADISTTEKNIENTGTVNTIKTNKNETKENGTEITDKEHTINLTEQNKGKNITETSQQINDSFQNTKNNNFESNSNLKSNNKSQFIDKEISSGFNESQSSLLIKYRETFININEMLLKDCEPLFMQIFETGYENRIGGGWCDLWI